MNSSAPKSFWPVFLVMWSSLFLGVQAATINYFITTGQTSAQTQIDYVHTSFWNFTTAGDVNVLGANFTLKEGSQTGADISFYVYQGNYTLSADPVTGAIVLPSVAPVASQTLSNLQFLAQAGSKNDAQQWGWHEFLIGTTANPFILTGGQAYTAVLYSDASKKDAGTSDAQSYAYFIKGEGLFFSQDPKDPTNNPYLAPANVPEPSSVSLLSAGLACLILYRGGRRLVQEQFSKKI